MWRVLDINSKALFMPCANHTLNLIVADAAKSIVESVSFFGALQFKHHVPQMTLKALSKTHWECSIESVNVLRYQFSDIGDALQSLVDHTVEKGDSETTNAPQGLKQEIMPWGFLLNILYEVNSISKLLQSPEVGIDVLKHGVD